MKRESAYGEKETRNIRTRRRKKKMEIWTGDFLLTRKTTKERRSGENGICFQKMLKKQSVFRLSDFPIFWLCQKKRQRKRHILWKDIETEGKWQKQKEKEVKTNEINNKRGVSKTRQRKMGKRKTRSRNKRWTKRSWREMVKKEKRREKKK